MALSGDSVPPSGNVTASFCSSESGHPTTAIPGEVGKGFLSVLAEHKIVPVKPSSAPEKKRKTWMFCGQPVVSVPLYFHFWKMLSL